MQAHPSPDRLQRFMTGSLPRAETPTILRHLASGCDECSTITSRLWEVEVTGRQAPRFAPEEYDAAFDRAWQRAGQVHERLRRERKSAQGAVEQLLALSDRQRRLRLRNDARLWTLPVCELLLEKSKTAIFDCPTTAAQLACMAKDIAADLDSNVYGAAILADTQADAWATWANALREASDFDSARTALQTAARFLAEGTGDAAERAKYLSSLANLLIGMGRTEEALTTLGELEAIYGKLGDRHMLGRIQLKRAFALHKTGDFDREIRVLAGALELLDPARDPRRQVVALHNLVTVLVDTGRTQEADLYIERLKRLHLAQGDRLNLLRFRWLEGRLAYAKNEFQEAARVFSEVRSAFIDLETGFDMALVSLDLAEVLWMQGKVEATRERLGEAIPILKALGVHAEARAAIAFLEHAARVETVTSELIRQTAAFVRRVQVDPAVRFRPAELTTD